jgi:prepilin signal peptidase PulO-like enzyme (type II secretory pathway)
MTGQLSLGNAPAVGFGNAALIAPAVATSPWKVALVTSVVSAATGWVIEEVAQATRRKRRR